MKNYKGNVFLTGGTGFLGSFLAKTLIDEGYFVYILARRKKSESAEARVIKILKFVYGKSWSPINIAGSFRVMEGDIVKKDLGFHPGDLDEVLKAKINIIIHSAALADLMASPEDLFKNNISGTAHMLDFAKLCYEGNANLIFNHISTIYVAGDFNGSFTENDFNCNQVFNNHYEKSKFEAESLVRNIGADEFCWSIFRPSLVAGDSTEGKTNNFRLFYQPLHYFVKELFSVYPADFSCSQNLINVDTVANMICKLLHKRNRDTYHIISPNNISIATFMQEASRFFNFTQPECIPLSSFNMSQLTMVQKSLLTPFLPYFNNHVKFVAKETFKHLGDSQPGEFTVRELRKLFEYCIKSGYLKKRKLRVK